MTKYGYYVYPNKNWKEDFRKEIWESIIAALNQRIPKRNNTKTYDELTIFRNSDIDNFKKLMITLYKSSSCFGPNLQRPERSASVPPNHHYYLPSESDERKWTSFHKTLLTLKK